MQDRIDQAFECNSPDVIFENFGDETILVNLASGRYYSLNPAAMAVWDLICRGVKPRAIVSRFVASYNGSTDHAAVARDIEAAVEEMLSERLIRASSGAAPGGTDPKLPEHYEAPVISKFDDVADLLLLDPVHDVGEAGWPHADRAAAE